MENEAMTWIILAGGHSRRMGQPKDQLPWGSGTLLSAAVEKAAMGYDRLRALHMDGEFGVVEGK